MRKRLEYQGGIAQEARMIKDKYKTFLKTLKYSYQGADVQLVQHCNECLSLDTISSSSQEPQYRALINPDKLKQDYDIKILSVDYNTGYKAGDVIQWVGTQSHWLIYLQELTEDAYFRSGLRRCRYMIKFKDKDGKWNCTWAAIRGPVETTLESIQKNQLRIDRPNWSLNILLPLNDKTKNFFDRYSEFIFADKCWRVEAVDSISVPNIIEINAEEYYIDKEVDDVLNAMKDRFIIEPVNPTPDSKIKGETFIKPKIAETYTIDSDIVGCWQVLEDFPITLQKINANTIKLTWEKMTSGQFTLQWTDGLKTEEKVIVVESLF